MRVLLTTDTIGGVWTYTRELSEGLLRRGACVALVSFGRAPSAEQAQWCAAAVAQHPSTFHYTASTAPLEWMPGNEAAYGEGAELLLQVEREFRPDVLHSNQFCYGSLPSKIPKLVVAHSDVLSWSSACRSNGIEQDEWLARYRAMVQQGLLGADALVAPTHWMLGALAKNFCLPSAVAVIENGRTVPRNPGGARRLQAVTAGRLWDEGKNLVLLSAVKSRVPLLVAGEAGSPAPPVRFNPVFLGALSEERVLALFRESAIYVCPSVYEPFGLAPLEAALCGCAVLANDIASLREVWGDAASYFEDAASLGDLLATLADNPEALKRCQDRSRRRALFWTGMRMTHRYLELYQQLVAQSNGEEAHLEAELSFG